MYLKSIEIHGFKSFAHKIVFEFKNGITGIVGPNGSGKSNVGDAVRWVLGEQSAKQLRGAKMEDVIFSGTEARKPLGFAYVAITLDNSDHKLPIEYDEVTVARRVYRSGESEYLINGANCRLKDVQELFLDTGIGKEGYSIIGQGQIDKILSGKPEDRRELFDEAAGIVKYKKRKYTAEKNLEAEKLNLSRINDIISEIEKQIGPLEKQSMVAKVYLKLKEELKVLEVNQFLLENARLTQRRREIDDKLTITEEDLAQSKEGFHKTKEAFDELEANIEEVAKVLDENKNTLTNTKLEKEKLEGEIKVLKEQINSIDQNHIHYQNRIHIIEEDMKQRENDLKHYLEEKETIDLKRNSLDANQEKMNASLSEIKSNIEKFKKAIENYNAEIFEYMGENTSIKTNQQRYTTMLEQNNIKKVELNQKLLKNKSEDAIISKSIIECQNELTAIEEQIQFYQEQSVSIQDKLEEAQQVMIDLDQELNQRNREYLMEKSKLDSLKNMTERYDGYGQSIKKVMEQKKNHNGIIGVVADIIKVDKQYETAIEIALGGNIQNIVTDNEHTAKELITYLKKNKFGRATFLPLTNMTSRPMSNKDAILKESGVIGMASDLVLVDAKYKGLIDYLLGRIIVADNLDAALLLNKKNGNSLRIVTLEGDLVNPGGSMSGGAYKNSSNLLSRKRELEELEENLVKLSKVLESLEKDKMSHRDRRNSLRQTLEHNKGSIHEIQLKQNTARMKLNQEKNKQELGLSAYKEISLEIRELDLQMQDLRENIDRLNAMLEENEAKSRDHEKKIEELDQMLAIEREKESKAVEESAQIRLNFSSLEQSSQYSLENIRRIKKEIEKIQEEASTLKTNIDNSKVECTNKENEIILRKEKLSGYDTNVTNIEECVKELSEKKEFLSKQQKDIMTKREELSDRLNQLDKESYRLNSQKESIVKQLEEQLNYMWEEYELTLNSANELKDDDLNDSNVMKKQITERKNKIKDLGNVNVNAIEDYKSITDRYEFLKGQRDDLIEAEETLRKIIEELDVEMRKQFEEKFKAIKEQFDVVFKELFGGGKGTLELIEGEDILEAGIRIIAQPPGKKLQNMMQLSGGEKALTAISLLFAIQNLKPSPFCLLDEIEAALDDSNVKRFADYLDKLTKHTQFIIITHRRGTMAAADTLYGITMQEKGISTLVSVNLIENDLDK